MPIRGDLDGLPGGVRRFRSSRWRAVTSGRSRRFTPLNGTDRPARRRQHRGGRPQRIPLASRASASADRRRTGRDLRPAVLTPTRTRCSRSSTSPLLIGLAVGMLAVARRSTTRRPPPATRRTHRTTPRPSVQNYGRAPGPAPIRTALSFSSTHRARRPPRPTATAIRPLTLTSTSLAPPPMALQTITDPVELVSPTVAYRFARAT